MPSNTEASSRSSENMPLEESEKERLKNIILNTRDLPAMPHVAGKVLELSSDPETSAQRLQQVIADDQAMTARILKIANSALYASSRKIKTLTEAIVMLGFNSIRSLVITSAARNLYLTKNKRAGLKERLLWEHSIGAAFACRLLTQRRYPNLSEESFLAGLMHDIGKLVLNLHASEQFDEIVQIVYNENRMFCETEQELLGFDHCTVGSMLASKWKLSPILEQVIADHHNPTAFSRDNPLLLNLDLANNLCKQQGIGFLHQPDLNLVDLHANRIVGFTAQDFTEVTGQLLHTLETEMEIFL